MQAAAHRATRAPVRLLHLADVDDTGGLGRAIAARPGELWIIRGLYWSPAQQLAHMTRNGASLRSGDLYGTGTISSFDPAAMGSMLEISWGGTRPIELPSGGRRTFLEDGDEIVLRAAIGGIPTKALGETRTVIVSAVTIG